MADKVENLLLEHLKRFQPTLERVEQKITDLTVRVGNLGGSQAMVLQHLAHFPTDAAQQVSADRLSDRLDRIERRLELTS